MALEDQEIDIPFVKGQQTKLDPLLLPGDVPTSIVNASFAENGSLSRRAPWNTYGGSTVTGTPRGVCAYGDELLTVAGEKLYSYSDNGASQNSRGIVSPLSMQKESVWAGTSFSDNVDAAVLSGFICYVWRSVAYAAGTPSVSGIYAMIKDETTGAIVYGPTFLTTSATATAARVQGVTGVSPSDAAAFVILWADVNLLKGCAIKLSTMAVSATANIAGDVQTGASYSAPPEMISSGGKILAAYVSSNATVSVYGLMLAYVANVVTVISGPVTCALQATMPSGVFGGATVITVAAYSASTVGVFGLVLADALQGVYAGTFTHSGSVLTAGTAMANKDNVPAVSGASQITATLVGTTMLVFTDYAGQLSSGGTSGSSSPLRSIGINSANTVVQAAATALNSFAYNNGPCGPYIAGKAFTSNSKAYLPVYMGEAKAGDPNLQNCWFLYSESSDEIVAKALYGTYGLWGATGTMPPSTLTLSTGDFLCPVIERGQLAFGGGSNVNVTPVGVSRLTLDFSPTFSTAKVGKNQFFAGGMLTQYDGRSVTEAGFHLFPEYIKTALSAGALTGTYQYCALYEWTDNQGQRHQSAPSPAVTVTPAAQNVTINVACINMTAKANVNVVIYRTPTLSTTFYRLNDSINPIANSITSPMTSNYVDSAADSTLTDNEILYTVGGELDHNGPTFVGAVTAHQDRLWMVGLEDPTEFRFSQAVATSDGLSFNEALSGRIPQDVGGLTAIGVVDDKAILCTPDKKLVVFGDGPTPAGAQGTYSTPQLLPSDIGCSEPRSIVNIPGGMMYQSGIGIYLLNRALQDEYVGLPVEGIVSGQAISSAVSVPDLSQVKFTLPDYSSSFGRMLTYDTQSGQWASHYAAVACSMTGACVWNGHYIFANGTNSTFGTEDPDWLGGPQYDFSSNPIPVIWTSAKIHLGALGGFQRVKRLVLRGAFVSDSGISIVVTTPESTYTATLASTDAIDVGGYFTLCHHIALQKSNVIQFTITDTPVSSGNAAGCNFSSLTLQVGVKKGTAKLPAASSL